MHIQKHTASTALRSRGFRRSPSHAHGLRSRKPCRPIASTPSRTGHPASTPAHPGISPNSATSFLCATRGWLPCAHSSPTQSHPLTIEAEGREAARGDLRTPEGRSAIEEFFAVFCAGELRGPPKVLHAPGFSFSDLARKVVSIINLASVAAIESVIGTPVHPLRFRGNVYVSGWPASREFDLL